MKNANPSQSKRTKEPQQGQPIPPGIVLGNLILVQDFHTIVGGLPGIAITKFIRKSQSRPIRQTAQVLRPLNPNRNEFNRNKESRKVELRNNDEGKETRGGFGIFKKGSQHDGDRCRRHSQTIRDDQVLTECHLKANHPVRYERLGENGREGLKSFGTQMSQEIRNNGIVIGTVLSQKDRSFCGKDKESRIGLTHQGGNHNIDNGAQLRLNGLRNEMQSRRANKKK